MPAYKDKAKGTWYASFYYEDWTGKKVKKMKRGFPTKREVADMKGRIKENTWGTKEHILYKKLVPYFGKRKMCDIHSKEVIAWQNEMLGYRDKNGKPYSPVYLKTLHNQLSAVFNHAVRHYNLKVNPAAQAGNMGKPKGREMLFWTKAEYLKFAEAMMDKPLSYYAFEMLYWCGVREGELLALTPGDLDFEKQTVTISKSYQRIKGKDVITDPKTPKSNRVIQMPAFLCEEMADYIKSLYGVKPTDRIFTVTKSYLHREMDRGAKEAGVKRIRIHDLRHSHISLLIDMGFTALAIADRVGHESIDITYRYAHLFPTRQTEMADKLDMERKGASIMSAKNLDRHNRWRNKTVAFRVSPDEDREIETAVRLSGLTKQDYITRRLLCRDVVVQGNPRVYKALRNELAAVLEELERIEAGNGVDGELLDTIRLIAAIMDGMRED